VRRLRELKIMPSDDRLHAEAAQDSRMRVLSSINYYGDRAVRARMLESCAANTDGRPSAAYVAGLGDGDSPLPTWDTALPRPADQLSALWARGVDISRSLWDDTHLVFMLELDYLNVDQPSEPFLRPAEVFFKLEPAYRAAQREFRLLDLAPRTIVTGRGYQFSGAVRLDDPVVDRLARLAGTPSWFAGVDRRRPPGVTTPMSARQAGAAEGLGRLIEYTAQRVLARAVRTSEIPVVFNGTVVGQGRVGRECVSIDFSHVGDPLDMRLMRLPFSTYQWHRLRPDIFGLQTASLPALAALPRGQQSLFTSLSSGRGLRAGIRAARSADGRFPDVAIGIDTLLTRYSGSRLAGFHRQFDADRSGASPTAFVADPAPLPPCVTAALTWPNDRLLKPEHIQHLVRVLMARGLSAAAIAALVQSVYETDHQWGDRWLRMDPRTRADFDVRVFAGLIATGLDSLVDFNCVSAQEKDICGGAGCQFDLRVDRDGFARAASG
jgi:hypothetical protein